MFGYQLQSCDVDFKNGLAMTSLQYTKLKIAYFVERNCTHNLKKEENEKNE